MNSASSKKKKDDEEKDEKKSTEVNQILKLDEVVQRHSNATHDIKPLATKKSNQNQHQNQFNQFKSNIT